MIVTQNLNKILYYAHDEAERLRNKTVEPEHLLLAIIRLGEGSAYDALMQALFDPVKAKQELDNDLMVKEPGLAQPVTRSPQVERILRIAEGISREYNAEAIGSIHLLLAILREQINRAAMYLENIWTVTYPKLVEIYGQPHNTTENPQDSSESMGDVNDSWQPQRNNRKNSATTAIDKYGHDLTKQAEQGLLDPVVGREVEIERVMNPVSVSPPSSKDSPSGSSPKRREPCAASGS